MKLFRLRRFDDPTGVSGTGTVAEGVQFADGSCVLRWTAALTSTGLYASIDDVLAIHGHQGATVAIWERPGLCPHCDRVMRTCCDSAVGLDHQSRCPDYAAASAVERAPGVVDEFAPFGAANYGG